MSKAGWAALCVLSFALGLASKENAAVLPLTLYVIELCFFQDLGLAQTRRRFAVAGLVGGILLLGLGSFMFFEGDPLSVLSYGNRFFSPSERLLTQARVLVFYLSQIFYPAPTRLSIEHDIAVSTSLIDPWTTLAECGDHLRADRFCSASAAKTPAAVFCHPVLLCQPSD